ncbi:bifunctional Dpy-19-Dpy-19-like/Tetratricopeptide-like helical domain superfamily/C-mannosyltransferase Dpy-19 [Babesia duncani]|uniref:Bifunctional Dpy-19-Dpy-19-like/Tetratricopeptide-like helical domain superfamily/C-mannosyltransferase Dpy-19 n=1 Tax=Babesia duncani TaxID=323732 RepID=A0AAD9PIT3_9APIC|nr:bifunctional Dpy-19-Dpy-19-like/Tetratricopeptide-like helical domain superfamily/C-mannosyltransferase Dpy-19 [Babesia duncani]
MYYSESAFYLSFYMDIVSAENWTEVFNRLWNDDRTEYPEVVISFRRLNIVQEIILGCIYRLFRLNGYIEKPFNFYAIATLLFHAFGVAVLFALACEIGKIREAGFMFLGLYFACFQHKLISRIAALPLRENFGTPGLWITMLSIKKLLHYKDTRDSFKWSMGLFLSYLWLLLSWQFSLQLISCQLACLFAMNVLGVLTCQKLISIMNVATCAFACSCCLMLFPKYYIISLLTTVLVSIYSTICIVDLDGTWKKDLFNVGFQKVLLAGFVAGCIHVIFNAVARPDSHVFDILFQIMGLSRPTFDSVIYLLGSEFRPIQPFIYSMIAETYLIYYFILALIVIIANSIMKLNYESSINGGFTQYILLQVVAFIIVAVMMSRLRVLALPLIPGKRVLTIAIACAPFYFTLPIEEIKKAPYGERYNSLESKDLVQWINQNVEPHEAILADMPTSSIIRACTKNKLVINPQYEYYPLRVKTWFYYNLGTCATEKWFAQVMLRKYNCSYLVVPGRFCTIFENLTEGVYNIRTLLKLNPFSTACKDDAPFHQRLCNRMLVGQAHFYLLYFSGEYMVYKVKQVEQPVPQVAWPMIGSFSTFKPWLDNSMQRQKANLPFQIYGAFIYLKKHFNSPSARHILDYGMQLFPEDMEMIRYYAEALDYDYGDYDSAKVNYTILLEMNNYACDTIDDFNLYRHYMDFLKETRIGTWDEVVEIAENSTKCLEINFRLQDCQSLCQYASILFDLSNSVKDGQILKSLAYRFWSMAQVCALIYM